MFKDLINEIYTYVGNYTFFILFVSLVICYFFYTLFLNSSNKGGKKSSLKYKSNSFTLIEDSQNLMKVIEEITLYHKILAVDTEYYRGNKYKGELCLIQLAILVENYPKIYILDIIKLKKLCGREVLGKFLSKIFEDSSIEKVLHAADNDAEWLYDEFSVLMKNIFDTQIAYQNLSGGKKRIGLDELLNLNFNLQMKKEDKKMYQRSDWKTRPLETSQLDYASQDSFYLIELRRILSKEMTDKKMKVEKMKAILQETLTTKLQRSKEEKVADKATGYLIQNCIILDSTEFDERKALIIRLFDYINTLAIKEDFNPDLFLNLKTIYKLTSLLPSNFQEFEKICQRHSENEAEETRFLSKYVAEAKEIFDIITQTRLKVEEIQKNIDFEQLAKSKDEFEARVKKVREHVEKEKDKQTRTNDIISKITCKKPLYDNCLILSINDEKLGYCDKKRMNWYIGKGLATLVQEDPFIFRLNFIPKNLEKVPDFTSCPDDKSDSRSYIDKRDNMCVVCGNKENYLRFHLVPLIYRDYLPVKRKMKSYEEVVLLCYDCQLVALKFYNARKEHYSEKYNVKVNTEVISQALRVINNFITKCKALHKNYERIPDERRVELSKEIVNFLQMKDLKENYPYLHHFLSENDIFTQASQLTPNQALSLKTLEILKNYKPEIKCNKDSLQGKQVVEKVTDIGGFIREWRLFFLENMKPRFIPDDIKEQLLKTSVLDLP